jgi:hypothetical protein
MGSWSESCGLSGVEISEGETAYVMVLKGPSFIQGRSDFFEPFSTLIKGSYNDYGNLLVDDSPEILEIFNQQTSLNIKSGDEFNSTELEKTPGLRLGENLELFWIHESIFNRLGEIKPDFPYVFLSKNHLKIQNIGEAVGWSVKDHDNRLKEAADKIRAVKSDDTLDDRAKAIQVALIVMTLTSHQSSNTDYDSLLISRLIAERDWTPVLEAHRRNSLLRNAAFELRKKIVPSERAGPQHAGHDASIQFANIILETQRRRKSIGD